MLKKKRFFLYFFLTYFFVTFPLMLANVFVSEVTMGKFKKTVNASMTAQMDQIVQDISYEYANFFDEGVILASQTQLLATNMLYSDAKAANGLDVLRNAAMFDKNILDIFMYYGEGKAYSTKGLTNLETYFSVIVTCAQQDRQEALQLLKSSEKGMLFLNIGKNEGLLFLHYPVRIVGYNTGITSVNYCISMNVLTNAMMRLEYIQDSVVKMRFANGAVVYVFYDASDSLTIQTGQMIDDPPYEKQTADIERTIPDMGLDLAVYYRTESVYENLIFSKTTNSIVLLASIIVSTAVAIWLSKKRGKSLKTLETIVGQSNIADEKIHNEFDYVYAMVEQTVQESNQAQKDIKQYLALLKQQTALLLFRGVLKNDQAVMTFLDGCGISISEEYYFIGAITTETMGSDIVEILENLLHDELIYETTVAGQPTVVFLHECPDIDYLKKIRETVTEQLVREIRRLKGGAVQIGISQVYQALSMANYAFFESTWVLQNIMENSKKTIVEYWENIFRGHEDISRAQELTVSFSDVMAQEDFSEAIHILDVLDHEISIQCLGVENKRYLHYCILQSLILALKNTGSEVDYSILLKTTENNGADKEHFLDEIKEIIEYYCIQPKKSFRFDRVIEYIEHNFERYDLSLSEVAEQVGISKNYLSKLFKTQTGVCYISYITQLRMQKAKELLLTTDLPIVDIFNRIGYMDKSNYSKKFKAYYGINASEYRQKYKPVYNHDNHKSPKGEI